MSSSCSMHEAGHSKLVLWDNPEEWGGDEGGRGFRTVGYMYTQVHVLFMSMYGRNHGNIVK